MELYLGSILKRKILPISLWILFICWIPVIINFSSNDTSCDWSNFGKQLPVDDPLADAIKNSSNMARESIWI